MKRLSAGQSGGQSRRETHQGASNREREFLETGWTNASPAFGGEKPVLIEVLFDEVGRGGFFKDRCFAPKSHAYCPKNDNFEVT